jgi:Uma2 family endonuclease
MPQFRQKAEGERDAFTRQNNRSAHRPSRNLETVQVDSKGDESYCIESAKPIPDLSIEVIFTSGSLRQLERYKALDVPEAWFWEDGVLKLYHLQADNSEPIDRSQLPGLNDLDLDLLRRCISMAETDTGEAIRAFRQGL